MRPLPAIAFLATLLLSAPVFAQGQPGDAAPAFEPGETVRVDMGGVGGGHFLVYTPTDYDPKRKTPLIVCYHGLNGKPTTHPFRKNLDGKGFIILGMEYFERGLNERTVAERAAYNRREADAAKRAVAYVGRHLNIDETRLFIGGVSKGGWQSANYAEVDPGFWAGVLIIAAGRGMPDANLHGKDLAGKPIYIGVGETDGNNDAGKRGRDEYAAAGAAVTFVEYAGLGHAAKPDCAVMRRFLLDHGLLGPLREAARRAKQAEDADKLGEALTWYRTAAAQLNWHDEAVAAAERADALAEAGSTAIDEAKAALSSEDYTVAFTRAREVARRYAGSSLGDEAEALAQQWRDDPALNAKIQQAETDARADALEAIARDAEAEEDYAKALRTYGRYVESFKQATRFEAVNDHYQALRGDERIVQAAADQEAEADCQEWLSMADNYAGAGRADLARSYLQRIVDNYPDSSWAKQARKRLEAGDP